MQLTIKCKHVIHLFIDIFTYLFNLLIQLLVKQKETLKCDSRKLGLATTISL